MDHLWIDAQRVQENDLVSFAYVRDNKLYTAEGNVTLIFCTIDGEAYLCLSGANLGYRVRSIVRNSFKVTTNKEAN